MEMLNKDDNKQLKCIQIQTIIFEPPWNEMESENGFPKKYDSYFEVICQKTSVREN
jgi:hypothetical protein